MLKSCGASKTMGLAVVVIDSGVLSCAALGLDVLLPFTNLFQLYTSTVFSQTYPPETRVILRLFTLRCLSLSDIKSFSHALQVTMGFQRCSTKVALVGEPHMATFQGPKVHRDKR